MVIVNTEKKWKNLQRQMRTTHFVYLQMLSDVNKHPKQNRVSCFLIVTPYEKYIVPVNHSEKFGTIETIDCSESKVCVGDMKSFLHNSMIETDEIFGLIDLNWCHYNKTNEPYDFDKHLTNAHHHNYRVHYEKENVNDIIPLLKQKLFGKITSPQSGGIAQLGERLPCTQKVIGSIPFTSTI